MMPAPAPSTPLACTSAPALAPVRLAVLLPMVLTVGYSFTASGTGLGR
jgi:hypothetical protein